MFCLIYFITPIKHDPHIYFTQTFNAYNDMLCDMMSIGCSMYVIYTLE